MTGGGTYPGSERGGGGGGGAAGVHATVLQGQ